MINTKPFPAAAPDFSDPLGLLRACHERIVQYCDRLEALARHLQEKGADQEAQQAAEKIHRYFSSAARHHHADEEEDLFPLLSRHSDELADAVQLLLQEHAELEALWNAIEPKLTNPASIVDLESFQSEAAHFAQAYRAHTEKENKDVLDTAQRTLDTNELKRIGQNMAERRDVTLPTLK